MLPAFVFPHFFCARRLLAARSSLEAETPAIPIRAQDSAKNPLFLLGRTEPDGADCPRWFGTRVRVLECVRGENLLCYNFFRPTEHRTV